MGTSRVVGPDEEIYQGETLDLTEDDFTFGKNLTIPSASRATEYEPQEIENLIKVAEEIYLS